MKDNIITTIYPDAGWLKRQKKITILSLVIFGIIVFILSVIFQNIIYAIIRGFIFSIACLIIYYKSDLILNYRIQIQYDGKIIINTGLLKRKIIYTDLKSILLIKKKKYWLIGERKIKIPISTYPELNKQIEMLKTLN